MKFTVDRTKWIRGGPASDSRLLRRADGKQCCIGFCAIQMGATPVAITESSYLLRSHVPDALNFFARSSDRDATWLIEAYLTNDNPLIEDTERESRLVALFAANGHELEFVG